MIENSIYITSSDAEKLHDLIWKANNSEYRNSSYLQMLSRELDRATIVDAGNVPPGVITMNSQVLMVDIETGEEMLYTLVFPEDADAIQGKISVLAPIGTAMLGYRAGDDFEWDTPGGKRKFQVRNVISHVEASS